MKPLYLYLPLVLLQALITQAQNSSFHLHSIGTARQPQGDDGYTLDGKRMIGHRQKILSSENFGPSGTYPKSVVIHDGYTSSGSLENLSGVGAKDCFLIGAFDKLNSPTAPFTFSELDNLMTWSKNGGKVLIATGGSVQNLYNSNTFLNFWGYEYALKNPSVLIPTSEGLSTAIFNGPFGNVAQASQGAAAQGFLTNIPADAKVLARDEVGNPTMVLDCKTLDLIVADIDVFTDLSTNNISPAAEINNDQDRIWVNTVAFLDMMQGFPEIVMQNGQAVTTDQYVSYEWYVNDSLVSNNSALVVNDCATYQVKVTTFGGCPFTSSKVSLKPDSPLIVNREDSLSLDFSGSIQEITWFENGNPVSAASSYPIDACGSFYAQVVTPEACVYYSDTLNTIQITYPNIFTPNGDQLNDVIAPFKHESCTLLDFHLSIVNRWGNEVFATDDPHLSWDGTSDGNMLSEGTYFYYMRYTGINLESFEKHGFVQIVR